MLFIGSLKFSNPTEIRSICQCFPGLNIATKFNTLFSCMTIPSTINFTDILSENINNLNVTGHEFSGQPLVLQIVADGSYANLVMLPRNWTQVHFFHPLLELFSFKDDTMNEWIQGSWETKNKACNIMKTVHRYIFDRPDQIAFSSYLQIKAKWSFVEIFIPFLFLFLYLKQTSHWSF